ncbi:MAG TPA: dual specificity protein phosphatase family protein [Thermoplasmata archaeon]|nr:dual specificity protein phosphatase family protein [Thermoplasmata archaeon]
MTPVKSSKKSSAGSRAASPSEVVPGVFVGGWGDAEKFRGARFCVLDERPTELDELPGAVHVAIYDGDKEVPKVANLEKVADLMHRAHGDGQPVLVFCGHGIRRGPLGGAWYLHRFEGMSLDEAYDRIESVRPKIERPKEWMGDASALDV